MESGTLLLSSILVSDKIQSLQKVSQGVPFLFGEGKMKSFSLLFAVLGFTLISFANDDVERTKTGIALDTAWKKDLYGYAIKNVKHPSWGLDHSERNYQNSL